MPPRDLGSPLGRSSAGGPRAPRHSSSAGTHRTAHAAGGPAPTQAGRTAPGVGVGGQDLRPGAFPGGHPGPTRRPENLASGAFPTPTHLTPGRLPLQVVQPEGSKGWTISVSPPGPMLHADPPTLAASRSTKPAPMPPSCALGAWAHRDLLHVFLCLVLGRVSRCKRKGPARSLLGGSPPHPPGRLQAVVSEFSS